MKVFQSARTIITVSLLGLIATSLASCTHNANAGFTWNRHADWKPGTADGNSVGNPCTDSAGNPVWSYEYIANVPAGSDLDSAHPWYKLPSSGLMVWDSHWSGGVWAQRYDYPPACTRLAVSHITTDKAYRGDHYADVPVVRWKNPSAGPMKVSLTADPNFQGLMCLGMPSESMADIIIARTDASEGHSVHLLYDQTVMKTGSADIREYIDLPALNIENLVLDPGDDIIFSIRSRTTTTGYRWWCAAFFDNVTITVVP